MLAFLTAWVLVHQFTPLFKMAAVQNPYSCLSTSHLQKSAEAHFTQAHRGPQLGLIISNGGKIEEDRQEGGEE